jgi:ribonuclease PH
MGPVTVTLDCDVLQADGGTRTAAITAAYVALVEALAKGFLAGDVPTWPMLHRIAAISVGYVEGAALLDLEYCEDSIADVDLNIVATGDGDLVEVQGTGEQRPFARRELDRLIDLATGGIGQLLELQEKALAEILESVAAKQSRKGGPSPPKDEGSLWGPPT